MVKYFDWSKKQPVNELHSTELTIIYSNVIVSRGCNSFPKPVKNPVLYCTISLHICTRYLDVAMHLLDVTKGSWIIIVVSVACLYSGSPLFLSPR